MDLILGDMLYYGGRPVLADLVADGRFDLEFTASLEPEVDLVVGCEADPSMPGNSRDRSDAHPGHATHDI